MQISYDSVLSTIIEDLGMTPVSAKFVLKLVSADQKFGFRAENGEQVLKSLRRLLSKDHQIFGEI